MTILRVPETDLPSIQLMVLGDKHYGAPEQDRKLIKAAIKYVIDTNEAAKAAGNLPNCYLVGIGDSLDLSTKNNYGVIGVDSSIATALANFKEDFLPLISHGYYLGDIPGNHDSRMTKATGSDIDLIKQWTDEFNLAYGNPDLILSISVGGSSFVGYLTHGSGGGGTVGAVANSMMRSVNELSNADFYIQGHYHRPVYTTINRPYLKATPPSLAAQQQHFFTVGSCLKKSHYARVARFQDSETSALLLELADRKHNGVKKNLSFKLFEANS